MTIRARVAAYRDAVLTAGATDVRLAMSTSDAVALVSEMTPTDLTHPDIVLPAAEAYTALMADGVPSGEEQLMRFAARQGEIALKFWEGFACQVVDGVEIVRRPA